MKLPIQRTFCDYKDSGGVPWLGKVPEHWEIRRLKQICRFMYGDALPTEMREHGTVPVFGSNGHVGFHSSANTKASCIIIGRKGSFGKVNFSFEPVFAIDTTFFVDYRYCNTNLRWLFYLLGWLRLDEVSKDSAIPGLDREDASQSMLAVPPNFEQIAIVSFLDHMDRRIRRYIRAKQKLIKLLEEYKQVIIHQAVTRGLDPTVPLKPSGVDWLGEVPEHWEVMPLRRVTITRCDGPFGSGLKSSHYTDQGIRVVRLQNIGYAEFKNHDSAFISPLHYASLGDHTVEPGDLLIAGLGDESHPAGRACVAPSCIVPAMVKADCFRFRLFQQRLDPEFAALQLTATASNSSSILSTGATRQRMNLQVTASRLIALPPLHEQIEIVKFIIDHTSPLRLAVSCIDKEITLLREYRTCLISDVVTGKLDVRGIELPADEDAEVPTELSELLYDDITPDDCEIPEEIPAEAD